MSYLNGAMNHAAQQIDPFKAQIIIQFVTNVKKISEDIVTACDTPGLTTLPITQEKVAIIKRTLELQNELTETVLSFVMTISHEIMPHKQQFLPFFEQLANTGDDQSDDLSIHEKIAHTKTFYQELPSYVFTVFKHCYPNIITGDLANY